MSDLKPREWKFCLVEDETGALYFPRDQMEQFLQDAAGILIQFGGSFGVLAVREQIAEGQYETVEVLAKWQGQPARRQPKEPEPVEVEELPVEEEPVEELEPVGLTEP